MNKQIIVVRKRCTFCGAKRNSEFLTKVFFSDSEGYACKNNDLCVLKMAYKHKKKG